MMMMLRDNHRNEKEDEILDSITHIVCVLQSFNRASLRKRVVLFFFSDSRSLLFSLFISFCGLTSRTSSSTSTSFLSPFLSLSLFFRQNQEKSCRRKDKRGNYTSVRRTNIFDKIFQKRGLVFYLSNACNEQSKTSL